MASPHSRSQVAATAQPRSARRKDARPSELLAAALDLFVEKGFAATRADEVAKRAGVSKGTLFLYFASKEELFKAVVRENISGRYPKWHAELESYPGTTSELLHYSMQTWWAQYGDTKASGISKLIMSEANNFPELVEFYQREVVEPGRELIGKILQRGVSRGEFRPLDVKYGVLTVLAPMLYLVMWKHSLGSCLPASARIVPQDFIKAQIDTLLCGLCLPSPAPAPANRQEPG
ncbi:MAG: TetR/AcrR family transcriptional regulator [Burkholderiaceae bacterium]